MNESSVSIDQLGRFRFSIPAAVDHLLPDACWSGNELAEDAPQCLIASAARKVRQGGAPERARQERIMDALQSASDKIQIFILTCHPDWYRGFGQQVELEAVE
jgi:hypothetical protein